MRLSHVLEELKAHGVQSAEATFNSKGDVVGLKVEFAPVMSASPFVDKDGKPVDLDEGLPPLARDLIAEKNYQRDA